MLKVSSEGKGNEKDKSKKEVNRNKDRRDFFHKVESYRKIRKSGAETEKVEHDRMKEKQG